MLPQYLRATVTVIPDDKLILTDSHLAHLLDANVAVVELPDYDCFIWVAFIIARVNA